MSVRVNKARKFNGKSYVGTDALDTLISSIAINGNTLTFVPAETTVEGDSIGAHAIDLSGLVGLSNNGSWMSVTANNIDVANLSSFLGTPATDKIVTTDSNNKLSYTNAIVTAIGNEPSNTNIPTESAVKAYVDGHGISLTSVDSSVTITAGEGVTKNLATNLYIKKLGTATEGYAASYQLQIGSGAGATAIGDKIDIVKDQFLKSVEFIASATSSDVTAAGDNPGFEEGDPVLKFTFEVNTDGSLTPAESPSIVYVPVKELVDVYTAGNGINITSNVVTAVADTTEVVYTAADTSNAVVSVGATGIKVSGVQAAINYAVDNEHSKMSTAVSAVDAKVNTLAGATSTAVEDLNARIETVATSAATAVANASANLSTQIAGVATNASAAVSAVADAVNSLDDAVGSAINAVNTNVEEAINSAIGNVNTALTATVGSVNDEVESVIGEANAKVNSAVADVNTKVGNAITATSSVIVAEQGAVSSFQSSVNDAITARNTQLESAVEVIDQTVTITSGTNGNWSATVTNAKYILGVFDNAGNEIYPEIVRDKANSQYTLTADFGETQPENTSWNVIFARDLPPYTATVTYAGAVTTNVAYTNATSGVDAAYTDATVTTASTIDIEEGGANYTGIDTVAAGVANGTAGNASIEVEQGEDATPPTVPSAVTVGNLDYTGHNA